MISCADFIPAYSDLFGFIEKKRGKEAVLDFFYYLSDRFLGNLKKTVVKHGIRGCWLYWSRTLNEEAADFTMEMNEKAGVFRCAMHRCPSKGRLLKLKRFKPYEDYCGHCDVIYRRVIEPLGFDVYLDMSRCDKAACRFFVIRKKRSNPSAAKNRRRR